MEGDPVTQYNKLYNDVLNGTNDIYTDLMNKSDKVIDTINRVVEAEENKKKTQKGLMHMSIYEIASQTANTVTDIADELVKGPPRQISIEKWVASVVLGEGRMAYVGILIIVLSLLGLIFYEL